MCTSPEELAQVDCAKETIPEGVPEGMKFDSCATTSLEFNVMNTFSVKAFVMSCAIRVSRFAFIYLFNDTYNR